MSARQSQPPNLRAEPRLKVYKLGRAQAGGMQFKVHLLDVSASGARLHAGRTPDQGMRITLDCSPVSATGTVRWVHASRFGIRFDTPLVPADLSAMLAKDGES
jgi:hypothetical protein